MSEPNSDVVQQARATVEGTTTASRWIGDNAKLLGQEYPALRKEFRKYLNTARLLERSAGRRMCVGVFGPSQAGKSYLISALARKGTEPLVALLGDREVDFVRELNPEGGEESTGLVTRFTLSASHPPSGMSVALRLLTELDVVRILANSFYLDCDHSQWETPSAETILERVDEVRGTAQAAAVDGLDEDDFYALQEYFELRFRASSGNERVKRLSHTFWPAAVELAPRLPFEQRARLLSLLWGDIESFTLVYKRLFQALKSLNRETTIWAPIAALMPRETSIIAVTALSGLGENGGETLRVMTQSGREADLVRSDIAALTAELVIPMRDKPWDFFEQTDVLDFPGARSREDIRDVEGYVQTKGLHELFRRGKVAYLFDRYCAERELTSMLLCIPDSNQDVTSLPEMVQEWVVGTHGADPKARDRQRTALFLVLTKFDRQLEEKAGAESSPEARWSVRLRSSLLNFFGKQHDWPTAWNSKGAFNNTFWLRNPNFKAEAVFDYEKHGAVEVEAGVRAAKREYLAELKRGFLANADVQRHFAYPEEAWEATFRLNDGGVSHLAEHLAPLCDPTLKQEQVLGQLSALRAGIVRRLEPHFVGDDLDAEIKKKLEIWRTVLSPQIANCIKAQRFGELLREVQIDEDVLEDVYHRVASDPTVGVQVGVNEVLADLGLETVAGGDGVKDQATRFAEAAVAEWIAHLNALATDANFQHYFQLTPAAASHLIHELGAGIQHPSRGLVERVAQQAREASRYERGPHQRAVLPVKLAHQTLNTFIDWLGYDKVALRARPQAGRGANVRNIFAPVEPVKGFPALAEDSPPFELVYAVDWLSGLGGLMQETATSGGRDGVDRDQNRILGEVLNVLRVASQ